MAEKLLTFRERCHTGKNATCIKTAGLRTLCIYQGRIKVGTRPAHCDCSLRMWTWIRVSLVWNYMRLLKWGSSVWGCLPNSVVQLRPAIACCVQHGWDCSLVTVSSSGSCRRAGAFQVGSMSASTAWTAAAGRVGFLGICSVVQGCSKSLSLFLNMKCSQLMTHFAAC